MALTIPLAHDFTCPWCWIAVKQVADLADTGATFEWVAYELWPDNLEWPEPAVVVPEVATNRPKTPTRLELAYAAADMEAPTAIRPKRMRTHNAHEAIEFAKTTGHAEQLIDKLYRALWEDGKDINDVDVIVHIAGDVIADLVGLRKAIEERQFADRIVGFDDPAYAAGVFNVPTYFIGGARCGEQPPQVLRRAIVGRKTTA